MRMKHHGLGLPDRPNTRLFGCAATVSPVAVRESSALETADHLSPEAGQRWR
jgi:hypothetical protein